MKKNKTVLRKEVYDKYIAPVKKREKELKKMKIKKWWSENFFNVISTVIAIIALIISIVK